MKCTGKTPVLSEYTIHTAYVNPAQHIFIPILSQYARIKKRKRRAAKAQSFLL